MKKDTDKTQKIVAGLAKDIQNFYKNKSLVLVCPIYDSVMFVSDLARQIDIPLQIDFVRLTCVYGSKTIRLFSDITCDIKNKHVLVVTEIIDKEEELTFLIERLKLSNPLSIKIAELLYNPKNSILKPDFTGKN